MLRIKSVRILAPYTLYANRTLTCSDLQHRCPGVKEPVLRLLIAKFNRTDTDTDTDTDFLADFRARILARKSACPALAQRQAVPRRSRPVQLADFTRLRVLYMINYRVHVYKITHTIGASLTDKSVSVSVSVLWNLSLTPLTTLPYTNPVTPTLFERSAENVHRCENKTPGKPQIGLSVRPSVDRS